VQPFTYYRSPIGTLKITANERAVTAIAFVEGDAPCPAAGDSQPHPQLARCARQLREYFEGQRAAFDFPVEQAGTAFQQRAWRELRKIPCGATICYGEQALRMGNKKAVRAVGLANGKNKLSIVVPCHRVIGKDGSLTGYASGLWRKQWLLEHERKMAGSADGC
jgi:methylated-DNA-[protein]-cysteine S-methyltransferase